MERYIEETAFEDTQRKIEQICRENSLACKLVTSDPIKLVIWPDASMEGQISMLDEPAGHNGHGSVLTILFADADVTYKISGGFVVSRQLLGKLLSNARKLHYLYLWMFYRKTVHARRLAAADQAGGAQAALEAGA